MSEPGIVFDGVWKKFRRGEVHDSLRDLIPAAARRLVGRGPRRGGDALKDREFWALRDVSFEVRAGETLGIIGGNGAGKSTALKILNRILRPSRGYCEVRGRAGALIEVSAGFHQDLTGRQNVYLQGSIIGMRADEIARKFDQIVDFAGMGEFIDTPVKRYSSGMNARLGFSIAAHLDPEVLIIDEVLAVGDFAFQDRAFGRVKELAHSGIPVVLVSHQLERVATLCNRVLLLEKGQVIADDTAEGSIAAYVMRATTNAASTADAAAAPPSTLPVRLHQLHVLSQLPAAAGSTLRFRVTGETDAGTADEYDPLYVRVRSAQTGRILFGFRTGHLDVPFPEPGPFAFDVELQLNVPDGIYTIETMVYSTVRQRNVSKGPIAHLQVASDHRSEGVVQLFPRVTAAAPGETAGEAIVVDPNASDWASSAAEATSGSLGAPHVTEDAPSPMGRGQHAVATASDGR